MIGSILTPVCTPAPAAPNGLLAPRGSHAQFDCLFREHRDGLLGFLWRRLGSREDAEDALMQTFYKAWRAHDGFRHRGAEKQWLYGIAARVAIDVVRMRRDVEPLPDENAVPASKGNGPMEAVLSSERRDEVRRVLSRLTSEQRELVRLYYFEGRRHWEIADELGIPRTQVRGRLHRVRRIMERRLVASAPHLD